MSKAKPPAPEVEEAEPVTLRVRGEDVLVGRKRVNVRQVLGEALGVELDDQMLSEILHGLRRSMTPPSELHRLIDEADGVLVKLRQLVDQSGRTS